jgi:cell pole-organizing protein PopZ
MLSPVTTLSQGISPGVIEIGGGIWSQKNPLSLEANALARIVTDVELDMTQPAKVQEPSMEEILASIRRIIADDEKPAASGKTVVADAAVAKPGSVSSVPKPAPPAKAEEVFKLTDEMAVPNATQAAFQKIEPQDDLEFAEIAQVPAIPPDPSNVARPSSLNAAAAEILSHSTVSAVQTAFSSLASTVLTNNARTLEDLVKEMLRPMLKSWLDDNLPGLVERIVKAEIERVSRGRR